MKLGVDIARIVGRPLLQGLLLLLLAVAMAVPAHARRLALVVGNDDYKHFSRLDKAGNDAEAIAKELEAAGFEVSLRRDLGYRKMVVAFEEFYDKVKPGDELFVFYAGHGVQTERGAHLLPVDIEGETQSQVEKMSYPVNALLEELDRMKAKVSVVVIDACRDNPLRVRGKAIGAARGLSGPDVAKGQMVIISAGRNQRALDSLGANDRHPNGVFTRELLSRMRTPGMSMEALAIEVRNSVERLAQSVKHEQRPLIVNDMVGEFFLYPDGRAQLAKAAPTPPAPAPADEGTREDRFWDDAKSADNVEGYEAYLAQYPNGRYRGLARAHIARLNKPAQVAQNTRGADASPGASASPAANPAAAVTPAAAPAPASGPATAAPGLPAAAPVVSPAATPVLPAALPAPAPSAPSRTTASYALPNGDRYEGEVVGNKRSGRGVYRFANGDRYEGEFVDDQFRGKGVMHFANGDRYEGDFIGTTKQGKGLMVFANKDRYEGDFSDNLYHGQGTFVFTSGERYTGSYQRGVKHGRGEQLFPNKDRYVGPFENDKPQGKGTTFHANGDVYEGDFVQGVKQGLGTYRFANGDRYEGSFVDGVFSGKGRLYMAGGDRYEGDFRNNVKEGQGVHYFANKDRYEGGFVNGAQQGQGVHYFANGDRFVGTFAAGVRHGKGVHHFAGGQTREIEYVNGVEKKD
ncbi:MAG: caspase family protein [Rubrivivax sp.]|nr:caspase family protein [Rubrivivax sp.]